MAIKKRTFKRTPGRFPFLRNVFQTLHEWKTKTVRCTKKLIKRVSACLKLKSDTLQVKCTTISQVAHFVYLKSKERVRRLVKVSKVIWKKNTAPISRPTGNECAICLSSIWTNDETRDMCHGHVLHHDCTQLAITNGVRSCPLCRSTIPSKVLNHNFRAVLKHTTTCREGQCDSVQCGQVKRILQHNRECKFARGCLLCKKLSVQLYHHHIECTDLFCKVPMCFFPWTH
jgi:hypothetical protein